MSSISRRVIQGVSSNVIAQVTNVIIQFAGVPLLLKYWGPQYYGEWLIMFTIPSFIEISDFGLGGSATAEMSILKEGGALQKVKEILQHTFWFILVVGGLPFLLLYISSFFVPWYDLLKFENISRIEFDLAFPILIAYVYLTLFLTIPVGYYRVQKVYHRERYIAITFKLLEFAGLFWVVIAGYGVAIAALTYLAIKAVFFLVVLLDLRLRFSEFRLGFLKLDINKIRHLFKPSLALMVIFMGQNFLIQGVTASIGVVLGPTQVVLFNTTRTLLNMAKQIVNIVNLSFISEFSYAFGMGDKSLLNELFHKVQRINIGLSLISVTGVLICGQFILDIWTQHTISIVQPFFILMGVAVFLNGWWSGGLVLLIATNKQFNTGGYFLILSLIILGLIIGFLNIGGLTWIASMLILFEVAMIFIVYHFCHKSLEISPWKVISLKHLSQ